ncbi:hypothetical protein JXB01_03235 [Candidatus Micrarchaeota archaeon]|nr:hypothetical protein [Candidatus Micrarchaeota archaeon]
MIGETGRRITKRPNKTKGKQDHTLRIIKNGGILLVSSIMLSSCVEGPKAEKEANPPAKKAVDCTNEEVKYLSFSVNGNKIEILNGGEIHTQMGTLTVANDENEIVFEGTLTIDEKETNVQICLINGVLSGWRNNGKEELSSDEAQEILDKVGVNLGNFQEYLDSTNYGSAVGINMLGKKIVLEEEEKTGVDLGAGKHAIVRLEKVVKTINDDGSEGYPIAEINVTILSEIIKEDGSKETRIEGYDKKLKVGESILDQSGEVVLTLEVLSPEDRNPQCIVHTASLEIVNNGIKMTRNLNEGGVIPLSLGYHIKIEKVLGSDVPGMAVLGVYKGTNRIQIISISGNGESVELEMGETPSKVEISLIGVKKSQINQGEQNESD